MRDYEPYSIPNHKAFPQKWQPWCVSIHLISESMEKQRMHANQIINWISLKVESGVRGGRGFGEPSYTPTILKINLVLELQVYSWENNFSMTTLWSLYQSLQKTHSNVQIIELYEHISDPSDAIDYGLCKLPHFQHITYYSVCFL